jgi:hypothetical protein
MADYERFLRDREAQDAFWWLILQELRGGMRIHEVRFVVQEREWRGILEEIVAIRRSPDVAFSIGGISLEMVRPFPPSEESIEAIRLLLQEEALADGRASPPVRPPTPPVPPPAPHPPTEPEMDDTSKMFSLLELD